VTSRAGRQWLLGIDIGTGSVKALAVGLDGRPLACATVEHPMHYVRPGWSENDPDDWFRGVVAAVGELLAVDGVDGDAVVGMCLVSQRDPWVLLDQAMRPLRSSISWTDRRSGPVLAEFAARMGFSWLIDQTGVVPIAGLGLPTLLWIQRHEPEVWSATRRLLSPKDYVLFRLTGLAGTDVSSPARSVMNDIRGDCWSAEICAAAGIPLRLLPEITWLPWERVAELDRDAARLLGLRAGVPVAAGGGDDPSATLGAGAVEVDDLCAGTGTSSDWRLVTGSGHPDAVQARGDMARHVVAGRFIFEVCIESTGSSLRWFRDAFLGLGAGSDDYAALVEEARAVPPGADGLWFLPFVDGAKRAPWYLEHATGGFMGIVSGHTRAHLARALLEGIAFAYPATLDLVAPGRDRSRPITLVDGEARSDLWNQIKADVTGVPIRTTRIPESAAVGAAILAGQSAGEFTDAAEGVKRLVRFERLYQPDPQSHARYTELRGRYELMLDALRPLFRTPPADGGPHAPS
jgi:xylulokinase